MKRLLVSLSIIIMFILIGNTVIATTGTTNTSDLNFREKASTSSNVIQKISKGSKVEILETEGDWYKISYDGKTGYVSKKYVDEDKEEKKEENNSKSSNNNELIDYSKLNTTKTTDKVSLYVLPLLNSTQIEVLSKNDEVKLISINGDWAYVESKNNYGWLFASKLLSTTITIPGTVNENTNLQEEKVEENKTQESTENKAEEVKENNETEQKTEQVTETKTETEQPTTVNEAKTDTYFNDNKISYPTTMYVNVEAVNVRSEASATSKIVTSVGKDTPVTVKGKEGDWYKIEVSDGKGYIKADYLSKNKK